MRRIQETETTYPPVPAEPTTVVREYVWGPDYADEAVCQLDHAAAGPQAPPAVYFYLLDASYNVVGLTDAAGSVLVQYTFEPYGTPAILDEVAAGPLPTNRLGHQGLFFERLYAAVAESLLATPALAPRSLDPSAPSVGLYHNRNRWLSPELGRYLQRDPNETTLPIVTAIAFNGDAVAIVLGVFSPQGHYGNGLNLYAYLGSNPLNLRDPLGLVFDPFEDVDDAIGQYARDVFAAHVKVELAKQMIRRAIWDAALYAALAFAWDGLVWYLGEAALIDVIAGPFFSTICFEAGTRVLMADGSLRPIEEILLGQRVFSEPDSLAPPRLSPGDPADPDSYDEIDPKTWRTVELQVEDADYGLIRMTLLRPLTWLEAIDAEVGAKVAINVPGIPGLGVASVMAVEPCPRIELGPPGTAVVTGTFITERAPLIDLYFVGMEQPIGATPAHPFYSTERNAWVRASELIPGGCVCTVRGEVALQRSVLRPSRNTVYNLEVAQTHTYFVSDFGLRVHNECNVISRIGRDSRLAKEAQRAGRSVQRSLDDLVGKLAEGNLNPGLGTKNLFGNVFYARAKDGARVFFRVVADHIEILAKACKENEDRVIRLVEELFR